MKLEVTNVRKGAEAEEEPHKSICTPSTKRDRSPNYTTWIGRGRQRMGNVAECTTFVLHSSVVCGTDILSMSLTMVHMRTLLIVRRSDGALVYFDDRQLALDLGRQTFSLVG